MAKKDKDKIKVDFIGGNADGVTGSMTLISFNDKKILLECGMVQHHNVLTQYKINSASFKFKAKDIDYLFIAHAHIDHCGNTGKLMASGFRGRIITTDITREVVKPLLLNSNAIMQKDAIYLKRKPISEEEHVYHALDHTESFEYDRLIWLDEEIGFKWLKNSHCLGSAMLELYIKKDKNAVPTKVLYTSDIGAIKTENYYVDELAKPEGFYDLVVMESTYGGKVTIGTHTREKDIAKIKTVVQQVCVENKGRLLIPVFSFSRAQEILTTLYTMYHDDETFNTQIVCDSPLMIDIMMTYSRVLTGENKELFDKVLNWDKVRLVKKYNETKTILGDTSPRIILSSSGMLSAGRSVEYLKAIIGKQNCHVLVCGYMAEGTLGAKIKSGQKTISIDGKSYRCNCGITTLNSFSSHANHNDLLKFALGVNTNKIALVHGNQTEKVEFKRHLDYHFNKEDKTTKVNCVTKGCTITL